VSNRIEVEWDENKNQGNKKKHQVSFEEAATVFNDPLALIVSDDDHSWSEQRYHIIGESALGDLLVVTYTERGNKVRIISARTPTRGERRDYEEGN
jgi:uncharacterized DUF497 family protein